MQQGTDLFGPHVCLGRHLVKGQLERFMLPRLSLGSCLVLQFHIGPELHLLHVALLHAGNLVFQYLLGLLCEVDAACESMNFSASYALSSVSIHRNGVRCTAACRGVA